jgi:hypothetical protein
MLFLVRIAPFPQLCGVGENQLRLLLMPRERSFPTGAQENGCMSPNSPLSSVEQFKLLYRKKMCWVVAMRCTVATDLHTEKYEASRGTHPTHESVPQKSTQLATLCPAQKLMSPRITGTPFQEDTTLTIMVEHV